MAYVLRACEADCTSYGGFVWPKEVGKTVAAPDWKDDNQCGRGLHGWLHGEGVIYTTDYWRQKDALWYVLRVEDAKIRQLDGKCKFPEAEVVFIGSMQDAAAFLKANDKEAGAVIGLHQQLGGSAAALAGALSTLTAGDRSTLTAGVRSTLTAGVESTLMAGDLSNLTAGVRSTLTAGVESNLMAGRRSTLTAGDLSNLTAGDRSTLTAGVGSTLTAGDRSTLTAGDRSTLTAGSNSELRFEFWCSRTSRKRTVLAYTGEDGIEAGVPYKLVDGKVVKA